ncbi:MAG: DUF4270 domain-containing protein [Bacteroidaceae bacterium]|nr:DUF4270 domain-containing protein [Bacteroidaceae bacterium]
MGLVGNLDRFTVSTDTFGITTRTIYADSIYARGSEPCLGCVTDYDTGTRIRGNFTTQFFIHDGFAFPKIDSIRSTDPPFSTLTDTTHISIDQVVSDSVKLMVFTKNVTGDTLAPLYLNVYELDKPIPDGKDYLSNFNPFGEYIAEGKKPLKSMVFTMSDQTLDSTSVNAICIPLNEQYTHKDKNGVEKTYKNIGTYLMRRYYHSLADKDGAFDNYNKFAHNVLPGFYFEIANGEGAMATVFGTNLATYFQQWDCDTVPRQTVFTSFVGTREVLQTTNMEVNSAAVIDLMNDPSCTFMKTPSGLYTEADLPVLDIMRGHEEDSLSTVSCDLQCINVNNESGKSYQPSQYILMIHADSLQNFYLKRKLHDEVTSFIAVYSESKNSYELSNFSSLISFMYKKYKEGKKTDNSWELKHPNWNKVALVPVSVVTTLDTSGNTIASAIYNNLSLTSAKLVKGRGTKASDDVRLSVIYTKMTD